MWSRAESFVVAEYPSSTLTRFIHGPELIAFRLSVLVTLLDKLCLAFQVRPVERALMRFGQDISAIVHPGIFDALKN